MNPLHDFDVQLCEYVLGCIHGHLDNAAFAEFVEAEVAAPIFACLTSSRDDKHSILLTDKDLVDLVEIFEEGYKFDRSWVPYTPLHLRAIDCVREIRSALAPEYAAEWAARSAEFSRRLEHEDTRLSDGIAIVLEWVRMLRRFLVAMGATALLPFPEGSFPTPAHPDLPVPAAPEDEVGRSGQGAGEAVLAAIAETQAIQREMRDLLISQKTVKEYYDIEEFAEIVGRACFTCREWARLGRISADKKNSGRGAYARWVVSHEELLRYQREGLIPVSSRKG